MVVNISELLEEKIKGALVARPDAGSTGVIVLSGSSGRVDTARPKLFAAAGAQALALRWFCGDGQSPGICEIPLETFSVAIDFLTSRGCQRIVLLGTSKGAEAALLVASIDRRVDAVVAISPSSVVWGNIGAGLDGAAWPERSSWSLAGQPLAFVPAVLGWPKQYRDGLVSYRKYFEKCFANDAGTNSRARIRIEDSDAELIIIAGGDDALWPSDVFAREIVQTRARAGKEAALFYDENAGHRILFPGEVTPRSSHRAHGGSDEADAKLGELAWQGILKLL